MNAKIRQIIRSQWSHRNSRNPLVRKEARNLIRVHVQMLRAGAFLPFGRYFAGIGDAA
jgi:hypothetical protein